MAGPFCALWAQDRRAAAHSGGPRPSRPASASLRPRSGRGPAGGPHGPGLGQPSPHAAPRLGAADGKAGERGAPVRALWARPSRPLRPAGRYPCPPWAAWAPPAPPACGGRGNVRPKAAPLRGASRSSWAAAVARGYPPAPQGQAPCGGRFAGLAPLLPLAGRGVGAPARPGPHSVGAVGPSAPPARAGQAPASRPALARLRLCLRWCGSASAWPARRSGPAPLRRPAAEPRGGVRAPAGRVPCAAAIKTPRVRALPALRVAALVRVSRGWGAGLRRLLAGEPHRSTSGKAKASRLRRALPDDLRRGKGGQGDAASCGRSPRPTAHR